MSRDEVIKELVDLILTQEKEIDNLRNKIIRMKQYIEVYEELIEKRVCR